MLHLEIDVTYPLKRQCAACHRSFDGDPVFRQDTGFCCMSCAGGALCRCFREADLADDGVDGIGLAFGERSVEPARSKAAAGSR